MRLLLLVSILLLFTSCSVRHVHIYEHADTLERPGMEYAMVYGLEYPAMLPGSVLNSLLHANFDKYESALTDQEQILNDIFAEPIFEDKKKLVRKTTVMVTDSLYSFVSTRWFVEEFQPYYGKLLKQEKIAYSNRFDCDDYVSFFKMEMQRCHVESTHGSLAQAPLIGEIHYVDNPERQLHHAIIMIMVIHPVTMEPMYTFFEPQSNDFVELTKEQFESIYYIRF